MLASATKPETISIDTVALPPHSEKKARFFIALSRLARSPLAHRVFSTLLLLGAPGVGAYAYFVEPTWLRVRRLTLPIKGLPLNLDGLRLVQVSDLHVGSAIPHQFLRKVIATTKALDPDLVVLTGDYVHTRPDDVTEVTLLLQNLRASMGVFAVLGNHDYAINYPGDPGIPGVEDMVIAALERAGVQVLRNDWLPVGGGKQSLALLGIDELLSGRAQVVPLDTLPSDSPRLVLCHNPDIIPFLAGHDFDLLLCGHTHGGQIRIPPFPPPFTATRNRRFWAGLFQDEHRRIFVSRGIGYTWRARLASRPECVCITLTGQ
ncbi:MAG: metallophosphoesterase [Candidatus Binatia bacterium]